MILFDFAGQDRVDRLVRLFRVFYCYVSVLQTANVYGKVYVLGKFKGAGIRSIYII